MTDNFKQKCRERTYKNKLGYIKFSDNNIISNTDILSEIRSEENIYTNGILIGSCNSKIVNTSFLGEINSSDDLEAFVGIKYSDDSKEYYSLGNYKVNDRKYLNTTKKTEVKAFDEFHKLNDKYTCGITEWTSITLKDVLIDLCNTLGWNLGTTSFVNESLPVSDNEFQNNDTNREVLSDILECACSFGVIENKTLYLKWFDTDVSEILDKSQYSSLEILGEYGEVNSLVLKYSQIEGENVTREDTESIKNNGETQVVIADNRFLYTEELKQLAIENIWNRLKGFKYVACKITSYFGKPYLKCGNKISVQKSDGTYFDTYILKHVFKYDGTFYDELESPLLSLAETSIKNNKSYIAERIKNAEIIVKKASAEISATTESVEMLEVYVDNNIQEINKKFDGYVPENDFVTLENSVKQIQTDTYTKTEINTKLTDGSVTMVKTTSLTADDNGLTVDKTGSKTKGNLDADGLTVIDKTGAVESELLFAGYDEELGKTIVRTDNIKIIKYTDIGTHSRIQDYENGTGIFTI